MVSIELAFVVFHTQVGILAGVKCEEIRIGSHTLHWGASPEKGGRERGAASGAT